MPRNSNSGRVCDLEERTFLFAKNVSLYCKKLPKTISNREYVRQIIRASGSVRANYIEANETLNDKDFVYRVKICRKESKESSIGLGLSMKPIRNNLRKERKLFSWKRVN